MNPEGGTPTLFIAGNVYIQFSILTNFLEDEYELEEISLV